MTAMTTNKGGGVSWTPAVDRRKKTKDGDAAEKGRDTETEGRMRSEGWRGE